MQQVLYVTCMRQRETRKPDFQTCYIEFSDLLDVRNTNVLMGYQTLTKAESLDF